MKKCLNCNIEIGGRTDTCPLCQNSLTGEASRDNWPLPKKLKAQAFLYKLQLFIALAAIAVGLSLDFLLELNKGTHYSIIISLWLIIFEIDLSRNIKRLFVITRTISISALHVCILLLITAWYFGFFDLTAYLLVPIILGTVLIANLIFSLIDTTENALVYLLSTILIIVLSYAFMKARHIDNGLTWDICLMSSVVSLIGIIIFKGHKVLNEVRKRVNF